MARRPTSDIRVSASDALEFEPEPRRKRGIPTTVWLLLVLVLVTAAGMGGFLFGDRLAGLSGDDGGQIPVVHAAPGTIKERPQNPGGQEIPFRDYDINKRMQGEEPTGRVETLLPPPEQAQAPPRAPAQSAEVPSQTAPRPAQAGGEALLPAAPAPAPAPPPPPTTVAKAPAPQLAPPPVPPATAPSAPGGPIALVPKSRQPAAAKPAPAAPPTPVTQAAVVSGWQVQLAASRAATAAKAEGERLKQKHSDLLGKLAINIVRADLGAKGVFYRIRLGPARDKDQARAICDQLAKRGQGCLAIAPGK